MRAKTINEEMKVAAANAIAKLAREDVPDEVVVAYGGERPQYGKDYIIPSTFDPRLITSIPIAVAKAAMKIKEQPEAIYETSYWEGCDWVFSYQHHRDVVLKLRQAR